MTPGRVEAAGTQPPPRPPFEADFAHLARALLGAAIEIGGFDVAYVTALDPDRGEEVVTHAANVGDVLVAEGHRAPCPADSSAQFFMGVTRSNAGPTPQPDSHVARSLGLGSYVSVPIVLVSHNLYGTFCGASRQRRDIGDGTVVAMESFAKLLADHMTRATVESVLRRAVVAEEELGERAQFLAEAEHRLKSPLSVITGWAATLADGQLALTSEQRGRGIVAIRNQSALLLNEVVLLLDEATADVRVRRSSSVVLDLARLVSDTAGELTGAHPRHLVDFEEGGPVRALADSDMVRQVLAHLVDNAAKYSPDGTTITLSTAVLGGWAVVQVCDEGGGVPDTDIFDAFSRGAHAAAGPQPGVGLGLHIVRKLMKGMGGDVTAARNPTVGSTFTVRLPLPA
jgi:signal transduction histidine kinase